MKEKRQHIIYKVTNRINGKIYIGQTSLSLTERKAGHIRKARAGCPYLLARAIVKYGADNFIFETINHCSSKEELDAKEIELIREYKSKSPVGYNMTDGGEGTLGFFPGEETRLKMGKAHKGNKYSLGVKHSEEWKTRKSKQMLGNKIMNGRKLSDKTKEKLSRSLIGNKNSLGRKLSQETINKRTAKQKGMKRSEETKAKMRKAFKGRKLSEQARANMVAAWVIRKQKTIRRINQIPLFQEATA